MLGSKDSEINVNFQLDGKDLKIQPDDGGITLQVCLSGIQKEIVMSHQASGITYTYMYFIWYISYFIS